MTAPPARPSRPVPPATPTVGVPNTPGRYRVVWSDGSAAPAYEVGEEGKVRRVGYQAWDWPNILHRRATWTPLPAEPAETGVGCIECGKVQTHRVCATCFQASVDSETPIPMWERDLLEYPEPLPLTFGCRVRAGDVEGVWEDAAGQPFAGWVVQDGGSPRYILPGMERHLVVLAPAAPAREAWTLRSQAAGLDLVEGWVWQRGMDGDDTWTVIGSDQEVPWSEVPQPLHELVVREEEHRA